MNRYAKNSLAFPRSSSSFDQVKYSPRAEFGPAVGLVLAACVSLALWFGLAQAATWVARTLF